MQRLFVAQSLRSADGPDAVAKPVEVAARTTLLRENDLPPHVRLLVSGWAARYRMLPNGRRQILSLILPGEFCDAYLVQSGLSTHAIRTLSKAEFLQIPRARFAALLTESATVRNGFWRLDLIREAMQSELLLALGQKAAHERIAHVLCETYARLAAVGLVDAGSCDFQLKQTDLAEMCGLTPIHVNRMLQRLRADGLIQLSGSRLTIYDFSALARITRFDPAYLRLGDGYDHRISCGGLFDRVGQDGSVPSVTQAIATIAARSRDADALVGERPLVRPMPPR